MNNQITNSERSAMCSVTLNYNQWRTIEESIRRVAEHREKMIKRLESQGQMTEKIKEGFDLFTEADRKMLKIADLILETVDGNSSPNYTICLENYYWMAIVGCLQSSSFARRSMIDKMYCRKDREKFEDNINFLNAIEKEMQKIINAIENRVLIVKHYVVVLNWAKDDSGEQGVSILGVAHSLPDAKKIFAEHIDEERTYAANCNWVVDTDTDTDFDAGEDGSYIVNHTHLYIEEVE